MSTYHYPRDRYALLLLVVLIVIAIARIFPTYSVFTATADEPFHIGAGMEWLDKGTYTYELQHPPLARIAVAFGPYLSGIRSHSLSHANDEGNAILFSNDKYFSNLRLARLGTLPFFVLGCIVVWSWARRWFGTPTACFAVFIFTFLPPILGNGALATLDMACAATVAAALYGFMRWIEEPGWRTSLLLGVAAGTALLSKFSSLAFLGVCFVAVLVYRAFTSRKLSQTVFKSRVGQIGVAAVVTFLLLWAGYRFTTESLVIKRGGKSLTSAQFENPLLRHAFAILETPIPLGEMTSGIRSVYKHNKFGHDSYLLGEFRSTGWWYFFPVVLSVKTPIGFLVLMIAGIAVIVWRRNDYSWQQKMTMLFPILILLLCMTSRINLGIRHVLPVYPLLSILSGYALAFSTVDLRRLSLAIPAVLLAAWGAIGSIAAHPDYLAYFNEFASGHPERILAESDLDWGQDLHRLADRLKSLEVKEVAISYFGSAPLDRVGLPSYRDLSATTPTSGYVAISVHNLVLLNAQNGSFAWLKDHTPIEKIGKSIYLYRIPASTSIRTNDALGFSRWGEL
jgi:4-amino-4-deoxy-L-arabinose transferase-like glycosyltransferase